MKITKQKKIEGCLEGANVKDIKLDGKITKELVYHLGKLGKLIFTDELEKPFFRIIVRGQYTMKGCLGNKTIRILLPNEGEEEFMKSIAEHLEKF